VVCKSQLGEPVANVWLPRGMEWLSGLPTGARKRRLLLPLQAVIDESGVEGTDPIFVFAGFLGQAERWAQFSDEWQAWADARPAVRYLKMYEAAKLKGEFRDWSPRVRDAKLEGFIDIMRRFPEKAIYSTLDVSALRARPDFTDNPVGSGYWGMFFSVLAGVCYEVLEAKSSPVEPIEIIFDEHAIFGPRINLWYPFLRTMLIETYDAELANVLPPQPMFRDDQDFRPLQAADVIAWLFRMSASGRRNEFEWIADRLAPVIPMSGYSGHFDEERLDIIAAMARKYRKHATPGRLESYMKQMGMDIVAWQRKRDARKKH
jgi:hypothetical protein